MLLTISAAVLMAIGCAASSVGILGLFIYDGILASRPADAPFDPKEDIKTKWALAKFWLGGGVVAGIGFLLLYWRGV